MQTGWKSMGREGIVYIPSLSYPHGYTQTFCFSSLFFFFLFSSLERTTLVEYDLITKHRFEILFVLQRLMLMQMWWRLFIKIDLKGLSFSVSRRRLNNFKRWDQQIKRFNGSTVKRLWFQSMKSTLNQICIWEKIFLRHFCLVKHEG